MNKRPEVTCVSCEDCGMSEGALQTSFRAAQLLAEVNEPTETPDRNKSDIDLTRRPCDGARSCDCS